MSEILSHVDIVGFNQEREPDVQYSQLLERILSVGKKAVSGMDQGSTEVLGHTLEYDLENGFPLITERDLTRGTSQEIIDSYTPQPTHRELKGPARQGLAEIIAFINGARTQVELERYGCKFWLPWTSDENKAKKRELELGDLGPGSYGAAFHDFPTTEEGGFNQYESLVQQIKSRPELRTHIVTPFIPQYISRAPGRIQKVLVAPCHGLQHYNVDVDKGEISLVHWQRSADVPIGLPFNLVHYAALLMMVAQVTNLKPRKLIHMISNAHVYDQHKSIVEDILDRPPMAFPILMMDPSIDKLKDFRVEHFSIKGYYANPPINMGGTSV